MFSYTDEAIVTSSPTGRHLSTVIRALPGVPTDLWRQHAEAVCKVLNELRPTDSVTSALQVCGRFHDEVQFELTDDRVQQFDLSGLASCAQQMRQEVQLRGPIELCTFLEKRIESLERELADAHEKLKAPIEINSRQLLKLNDAGPGSKLILDNRTFKRVE